MTKSNSLNNQDLSNLVQRLSVSEQRLQRDKLRETQETAKAEALGTKLWEIFAEMYGHKLVSQYGESPPDAWVRCLTGISGQQIADGLHKCIDDSPEWPPTAPQFRNMCLGIQTDGNGKELAHAAGMYKVYGPKKQLPEPPENKHRRHKVADETLTNLKGMFDD